MQTSSLTARFTSYSKIAKLNVMLLTLLLVATTMAVTFATNGGSGTGECGAHVALVLDRSSSIGVDAFSGSRAQSDANISAIKVGANNFVDALQGKDSYTDVYAFGSVAQRINTGGWFNVKDQDTANWQKMVIGNIKFKQGANSSAENAYNDGMNASGEGLTNWQGAFNLVGATRQDPFPTHLVIFTDGNPTTNQGEVEAALRAGGSFTAAGNPNVDGVDADDVSEAVNSAAFLRAIGIKIIPIAVGAEGIVNMANLQAIAGPGNPVYRSNNYAGLSDMFKQAAANICEPPAKPTTLNVRAVDQAGRLVAAPINVGTTGTVGGPSAAGENKTTSVDPNNPWSAKWSFTTKDNWRARITQTAVPAGYVAVSDECHRENLSNPDLPQREGSENSPSNIIMDPIMPGGNIYCQFVLKKITDGIELTKTVSPEKAKRGDTVTYTFTIKNTGNTKLTNIVVNDPMLGGKVGETIPALVKDQVSTPFTKTYVIPNNASDKITNVATATGTPVNDDNTPRPNVSDPDDAVVAIELRQGQEIEKTVTPSVAVPGTEVTYTIAVKNTGEAPLSNVVVFDRTLNKEVTIAGPIAPGAIGKTTIKYTLKAEDFKNGVFANVACIKGTEICDDAKVLKPSVELTKSGPTSARPGEKVTYTFRVKNTGLTDLTNIEIKDETLSKDSTSPVVIKVDGTLKPGESSVVKTYDYTIPKDYKGDSFKNVAVVHSNPVDPDTKKPVTNVDVSDQDDHTIALIRWSATKTADKDVVVPGTTVTYTITVKNDGGSDLKNIEVSDPTIGFPKDGKPVVIPVLKAGESKVFNVTYVIPESFKGNTFKNTALVCIPGVNEEATTNTTTPKPKDDCQEPTATVKVARIDITKTADKETALPGDKVIYTFVVENTGAVAIDPTMIMDDILGQIGDPKVIEPGKSETFTKEYTVPADAKDQSEIVNTVIVCAPVPGTNQPEVSVPENCTTQCPEDSLVTLCAEDDHTLLVVIPSIKIDKIADKTTANVGDTVTYTFTVTNTSKVEVTNISVTDNVLGDLGKIDKLGPGESAKKSITYIVPTTAATAGTIRNVATACFAAPVFKDNCASDDHTLTVTQVLGTSVTRPADTAVQQTLAFTGAQSGWLALVGGLLIGLGTALFFITRRRRNEAI